MLKKRKKTLLVLVTFSILILTIFLVQPPKSLAESDSEFNNTVERSNVPLGTQNQAIDTRTDNQQQAVTEWPDRQYYKPPTATKSPMKAQRMGQSTPTVAKLDVVFAIDCTGSMGSELSVVKSQATYIMNQVRNMVNDSQFGLVSFCDYPGSYSYPGYSATYGSYNDYIYNLNSPITADISSVASAIDGLSIRNGNDGPRTIPGYYMKHANYRGETSPKK